MIATGEPVEDAGDELPPVEELVKRLRPEVLATMEELFRAKWSGVKRLRPEDLKNSYRGYLACHDGRFTHPGASRHPSF
jgi:hypothetical protein